MYKATTVCLAIAFAAVLITAPAVAQEDTGDPLTYTATGDELWDAFAEAMLAQLEDATVLVTPYEIVPSSLPMATLVGWEDEFGDDPRYWQLCYWNATVSRMVDDTAGQAPIEYLKQGAERGASDAVTEMLLYQHRCDVLEDLWDGYWEGSLGEEEVSRLPDFEDDGSTYSWFKEQEFALVDELVAACPDESWAWYERAMKRFEYGEWETGLDDMRSGNQAANNRMPTPFPLSYVIHRVSTEQDCGSKVVAGMVAESEMAWSLPGFILVKDHMKEQEMRLSLGAPLNELAPWHYFTCRYGSKEDASTVQWLVALVLRMMLIKYLLVETPESFTIEQRDALWRLEHMGLMIKELVQYELQDAQPSYDELAEIHQSIYDEYCKSFYSDSEPIKELQLGGPGSAAYIELLAAYYRWQYEYFEAEYGVIHDQVKERFDKLATFDFSTYSWPPSS